MIAWNPLFRSFCHAQGAHPFDVIIGKRSNNDRVPWPLSSFRIWCNARRAEFERCHPGVDVTLPAGKVSFVAWLDNYIPPLDEERHGV